MATPIAMPKLGMTMQEGSVVQWPVGVGEAVEKGRSVVVIESEKTQVEIEATESGVLRHLYVEAGETVPCGSLLGAITASMDEPFDAEAFHVLHHRPFAVAAPARPSSPHPAGPVASSPVASSPGASVPGAAAPVTPAARAAARSLGIDVGDVVAAIAGSGPGGRITREDVEAYASRRERLFAVADGVSLEVLRQGSGTPVLLLPGFGVGVASMAPLIQTLSGSGLFETIGLHPRGIGASDAGSDDVCEVATAARDAAAVAASLGEPAHVVGASLGSAVAVELALRHPQQVRSLTLITPFVEASARLLAVIEAWRTVSRAAGNDTLARMLLPWLFSDTMLGDPALRDRMRRGLVAALAPAPPDALDRWALGLTSWSGSRTADLSRLRVPTLVIVGTADLLTADGEAVADAIASSTLCRLDGVGHAAASEAADAVSRSLLAHLRAC